MLCKCIICYHHYIYPWKEVGSCYCNIIPSLLHLSYTNLLHTTCIYLTNFNQLQNNFYTLLAIIDLEDGLILFWSILAVLQFFLAWPSGWGAGLSIQESLVVAPNSGQPSILPRLIIWVPGIAGDIVVKSNLSPRIGSAVLSYLSPIHKKKS